jgi:glycosyltransferase involved in cell wall biosynthesis
VDGDVGKIEDRTRVLAVIDHLGGGGAEGQFLHLARRLDPGRFDLRVLLTEGGGARLSAALDAGLAVDYPGAGIRRDTRRALRRLKRAMAEFGPHVIMAWLSYSVTLTAWAAGRAREDRLVFSERSSLERLFGEEVRFGRMKKMLFRRAARRGRVMVVNSRAVAAEFEREGYARPERIRVIRNGVDLDALGALPAKSELKEELGLEREATYGVYVGKFEYRKGLTFLMEALGKMGAPGLRFLALGAGSMEPEMHGHPALRCLGYREDAVRHIKAADFLVLPSLYEGLPNVVLEAMALGTPVIATRVDGVPEVIEHGRSGLLVEPGDAAGLGDAMERIIRDVELGERLAGEASARVVEFAMPLMVNAFEDVLLEVSRKARGRD